jgi:hypothetical protein
MFRMQVLFRRSMAHLDPTRLKKTGSWSGWTYRRPFGNDIGHYQKGSGERDLDSHESIWVQKLNDEDNVDVCVNYGLGYAS